MSRPVRFLLASSRSVAGHRFASTAPKKTWGDRVSGITDSLVYFGRLGIEFGKQVGSHQKVALPNVTAGLEGTSAFFAAFQNGSWKKVPLSDAAKFVGKGIEVFGFFLVGEMIGRFNVIGYKIPGAEAHGDHH
ncbi:hypothetical protein BJ742DRAFT_796905 [Cladochytrium replicatum]|nr:hypothetical protein BJ742DRAFT_796905 [Cladochytrium replicatum]